MCFKSFLAVLISFGLIHAVYAENHNCLLLPNGIDIKTRLQAAMENINDLNDPQLFQSDPISPDAPCTFIPPNKLNIKMKYYPHTAGRNLIICDVTTISPAPTFSLQCSGFYNAKKMDISQTLVSCFNDASQCTVSQQPKAIKHAK